MKQILFSMLFFFTYCSVHSQYLPQYLVSNGGDYYKTSEVSISWSLGELATETLYGTNFTVTQGFQQVFDARVGIKNKENSTKPVAIVYPNPTFNFIKINIEQTNDSRYIPKYYQLYNAAGQLLLNKKYINSETKIDIQTYQSGIYLVKLIYNNSKYNQTHKIQKLN